MTITMTRLGAVLDSGRRIDRLANRRLEGIAGPPGARASTLGWRITAVLIALPVHALSIGLVVGGGALAIRGAIWPLQAVGAFCLVCAVLTRPHFPERPDWSVPLTEDSAPRLFEAARRVAASIGAPVPREIHVTSGYNMFARRVGWRQTPILVFGGPLWAASSPQQRVALMGQGMGDLVHTTAADDLWITPALETLDRWRRLIEGSRHENSPDWGFDRDLVARLVFAPALMMLSVYTRLIRWAEAPLRLRLVDLADLDAATAGGTAATVGLMDVLLAVDVVAGAVTRVDSDGSRPEMGRTICEAIAAQQPRAVLGRRTGESSRSCRVDEWHPTTQIRLRAIQAQPERTAEVTLNSGMSQAIDVELNPAMVRAAKEVADLARYQGWPHGSASDSVLPFDAYSPEAGAESVNRYKMVRAAALRTNPLSKRPR